jgi:5-(carboxyamino)imidazole ribonucleotide mutase
VRVVSAHRTPDLLFEYASSSEPRAASRPSSRVPAARPTCPACRRQDGAAGARRAGAVEGAERLDSLLSIVQMPAGIPVATFAIGRRRHQCGADGRCDPRADAGSRAKALDTFRAAQTEQVLAQPDPRSRMTTIGIVGAASLADDGARRRAARPRLPVPRQRRRRPAAQVAPMLGCRHRDEQALPSSRGAAMSSLSTGRTCRSRALEWLSAASPYFQNRRARARGLAGSLGREDRCSTNSASVTTRYAAVDTREDLQRARATSACPAC